MKWMDVAVEGSRSEGVRSPHVCARSHASSSSSSTFQSSPIHKPNNRQIFTRYR
jgi:hypothetical protein